MTCNTRFLRDHDLVRFLNLYLGVNLDTLYAQI